MFSKTEDFVALGKFQEWTLRMDKFRDQKLEDLGEYGELLREHFSFHRIDDFNKEGK